MVKETMDWETTQPSLLTEKGSTTRAQARRVQVNSKRGTPKQIMLQVVIQSDPIGDNRRVPQRTGTQRAYKRTTTVCGQNDPNGGAVFNISKETTRKELVEIEGISEYTRRMQGINLSAGQTNAVEVCVGLFNMPTLDTLLEAFVIDQNLPVEDLELGVVKYITAIIPSESNLVKDTSEKEDDEAPASAS